MGEERDAMIERWREILRDLKHGIAQQDDTTPLWKACKRIAALEAEVRQLRMDRHCEHPQTTENRNFLHEGFRLGLEAALSEFGPLWSGDKVTVAEVRKRIRALRPEDIAKEAR